MKITNVKKMFFAVMMGFTLMASNEASARGRSHHYHGKPKVVYSTHHVHSHVRNVYVPRYVYRPVYYRPYTTVVPHYHYGFYEPCYDTLHTTGIYWNVNFGPGGWGIGFQSGW